MLAAAAAYDAGGEWLDGVLTYLDGNRRLLATSSPRSCRRSATGSRRAPTWPGWTAGLGLSGAVGGFFLERAGVALVDGPECGAPGEGHVRLNFATGRALLTTMVDRMAAAARSGS